MEYHDPDRLLDVGEAAALLGVKAGTLYSWASKGAVPHRKVGSLLRFHRGELLDWTAEQAREAAGAKQARQRRAGLRAVQFGRS